MATVNHPTKPARSTVSPKQPDSGLSGVLGTLHDVKFGCDPSKSFRRKDLILFLRNLSTLVENGVSLSQALETVMLDRSLKRYQGIIAAISRDLKAGKSLSASLALFPQAFNDNLINQIEVGERSGSVDKSLLRVSEQLEQASSQKSLIIKKLTYPAILVAAGVGSVGFMMLYVIPAFREMYDDAGATLPAITLFLIQVSDIVTKYGLLLLIGIVVLIGAVIFALKNPISRMWIDRNLLRVPVLGDWFRDLAVLQFVDVMGNLMASGFTLVEALLPAGRAVSNRHVRARILSLYASVRGGERFSQTLEREGNLFPPVVNQLVIVGERTGRLARVTQQIRTHIRRDVENSTNTMVGAIEPILTAILAFSVGGILLAVYLPMFDLIGQVNK